MPPFRRRPAFVLFFLSALAIPQGFAFVRQFADGFRPFAAAPHRVPLSWDMFAVPIERCEVFWNPPLPLPDGPLYRLQGRASAIEWEFVLDRAADYRALVDWTCARFGGPRTVSLICFLPTGKVVPSAVECR